MMPTSTKGILGHFYEPADALAAAAKVRDAGWKHFDFLTPFPIHGMEEAMGQKRSWIPYVTAVLALCGILFAQGLQNYVMVWDWPMNFGGKPFAAWPAFIPITFEAMVFWAALGSAIVAIIAGKKDTIPQPPPMLVKTGATVDRFVLWISATDPKWDAAGPRPSSGRSAPTASGSSTRKEEPMRNAARALALVALTAFLSACDLGLPAGRTPHREGNRLDMVDQPKLKPQRKDIFGARPTGLMEPQPGTVAVGESPYPYAQNEADRAGAELVNPLQPTPEVLAHGKFVYENVCITCHGPKGAGDGHVTALFPKPPSLMTQKVRDWPDGQLFHRPMRGQNSMPSHARQVDARDAWSVILYIREMQKVEPVAPPRRGSAAAALRQPPAPPPLRQAGQGREVTS